MLNDTLIADLTYSDTAVVADQTYYYVATAVDSDGIESIYSTESVAAKIPTP